MGLIYLWGSKLGRKPDIVVKVPLYYKEVQFFIGKNRLDDYRKFCQSIAGKDVLDDEKFEYATGLTMGTLVYIEDGDDMNTVIHEIYHATSAIIKISGIDDEEAEAYLNSWLVVNYLEQYAKRQKKNDKIPSTEVPEANNGKSGGAATSIGDEQQEVQLVETSPNT